MTRQKTKKYFFCRRQRMHDFACNSDFYAFKRLLCAIRRNETSHIDILSDCVRIQLQTRRNNRFSQVYQLSDHENNYYTTKGRRVLVFLWACQSPYDLSLRNLAPLPTTLAGTNEGERWQGHQVDTIVQSNAFGKKSSCSPTEFNTMSSSELKSINQKR